MGANKIARVVLQVPAGVGVKPTYRKTDTSADVLITLNKSTVLDVQVIAAPAPAPAPPPPAPAPAPAPAPTPAPPPIVLPDSPVATVFNRTQGTSFKGNWNACIEAANPGDLLEVSPGAVFGSVAETSNYYSNNLYAALLAITKPVTIRNVPGAGRWWLFPDDTWLNSDKGGICIHSPASIGGVRGVFVIEGFEFSNYGYGAGVRVMNGASPAGTFDGMHAAVTLRNFKFGKRPQAYTGAGRPHDYSESGISGAARTLVIENGTIFDCGGLSAGQDHNVYASAETMTIRGLHSLRTRGILDSAGNPTPMDGHMLKVSAVNGLIERCVLDGYSGDMTHHVQMKAGGNWAIRKSLIIDGLRNQSAGRGTINMCRELAADLVTPNYEGWAGRDGNSLLVEECDFVSPYGRPLVHFFPAGHVFNQGLTLSAVTVRGNRGMVASTPTVLAPFDASKWIANDPLGGPAWPVNNTILPFDETEAARIMATAVNDTYSAPSGGTIDTTVPAWRRNMPVNTLVEVGDAPSVLDAKLVWPGDDAFPPMFQGSEITRPHHSYGGSVYAKDVGRHGAMIFGSTGEDTFHNQLSKFTLSDDQPTWDYWQQPYFELTSAAAATAGADWYRNPTDAAALDSNHDFSAGMAPVGWDGGFPIAKSGWVMRRKTTTESLGNAVSHYFRYNSPVYVPASMTGTGVGAILTTTRSYHGPWTSGGGGYKPPGVTDAEWCADLWAGTRRKHYIHAQNTATQAVAILTAPVPDHTGYTGDIAQERAIVDEANKRVYYQTYNGSDLALYYLDLSAGLAGATFSAVTNLTGAIAGNGFTQSCNRGCLVTSSGRRLWFVQGSGTGTMLVIDLDTYIGYVISGVTNLDWGGSEQIAFGWRQSDNTVIVTRHLATGVVTCWKFAVPADATSAGNYTASKTVIDPGTVTPEAVSGWQYGDRGGYIDSLGVVLVTRNNGKMLAYRPA